TWLNSNARWKPPRRRAWPPRVDSLSGPRYAPSRKRAGSRYSVRGTRLCFGVRRGTCTPDQCPLRVRRGGLDPAALSGALSQHLKEGDRLFRWTGSVFLALVDRPSLADGVRPS